LWSTGQAGSRSCQNAKRPGACVGRKPISMRCLLVSTAASCFPPRPANSRADGKSAYSARQPCAGCGACRDCPCSPPPYPVVCPETPKNNKSGEPPRRASNFGVLPRPAHHPIASVRCWHSVATSFVEQIRQARSLRRFWCGRASFLGWKISPRRNVPSPPARRTHKAHQLGTA